MKKETGIIMSGNHPQLVIDGLKTQTRRVVKPQPELFEHGWENTDEFTEIKCPYGQVGDRLYIKETHYKYGYWLVDVDTLTKTGKTRYIFAPWNDEVRYYNNQPDVIVTDKLLEGWFKRPSMFMFKKDARIWRENTEIRVERLRSTSPADAIAEGGYTVDEFIEFYLRINNLSEDADPWNWALSFKEG